MSKSMNLSSALKLAAALSCILWAAACSGPRSEQYRKEGDTYVGMAKYAEAQASYERAIAANPDNALAHAGLGSCFEATGKKEEALASYERAIEIDPALDIAYEKAILLLIAPKEQSAVTESSREKAIELADKLEKADPERGGIMHASILVGAKKLTEAIDMLSGLRDKFPDSAEVRIRLGVAMLAANRAADAEVELKKVLDELIPNSSEARMALIEAYRQQGKSDEITAEFESLVATNPDSAELKLGLARSLLYSGRPAEAETMAQEILKDDPESAWASYVLGTALLMRGATDEAIEKLQAAAAALPREEEVARQLALAQETKRGGNASSAPDINVGASSPAPIRPQAAPAKGDWQGLWKQAALRELVDNKDSLLKAAPQDILLQQTVMLSALFLGENEIARDIESKLPADSPYHEFFAALDKQDLEALLALFTSWKVDEDSDDAILRDNALGYALAQAGARGQALKVLMSMFVNRPENGVSLFNMAMVFRAAGQPLFAARSLQQLLSRYPENLDAHRLLYAVLRAGNQQSEARNVAETTYAQFPDSKPAIMNYAEALLDGHEPEHAKTLLEMAHANAPEDADVRIALSAVELHLGDADAAASILEGIQETSNSRGLAQFALTSAANGDWQGVLEQIAKLPEAGWGLGLHLLAVAAHAEMGDNEAAQAAVKAALAMPNFGGSSTGAILGRAFGLETGASAPEAAALGDMLKERPAGRAKFAYAMACDSLGQSELALDAYKLVEQDAPGQGPLGELMLRNLARSSQAADPAGEAETIAARYPSSTAVWLALASFMDQSNNTQGEKDALERALKIDPQSPLVWQREGQFQESQGNLKEARDAYEKALSFAPDDPIVNNNLAYALLTTKGDVKRALTLAKKADEAAPRNASILHTLGLAQLEAGETEDAALSLRLALELRPGEPTLMLDFGRLLTQKEETKVEGMNYIAGAVRYADNLGLSFPRRDEAMKMVDAFKEELRKAQAEGPTPPAPRQAPPAAEVQ